MATAPAQTWTIEGAPSSRRSPTSTTSRRSTRSFASSRRASMAFADGEHFFDLPAEDVIFKWIITTPGHPRRVEGRKAVADLNRPYGSMIVLDRCHELGTHDHRSQGHR